MPSRFPPILAMILPLVTATEAGGQGSGETVRRTGTLMGTSVQIEVDANTWALAVQASEAALRAMEEIEATLSTWQPGSELSVLNRSPVGTPITPTPRLAAILAQVGRWADRTGAAFHPAVGSLIDLWDFRGVGHRPTGSDISAALTAAGDRGVALDRDWGTLTRLSGKSWVDAGGFGKGAALRVARDTLKALGIGRGTIDLGGQLMLVGATPAVVSIASPGDRSYVFTSLSVGEVSVATSGQFERWISVDGQRFGHILDPRTGWPVPAWGSVTIVAADPLVADLLSTAFYVMGPAEGLDLANSLRDVAVLFLTEADGVLTPTMNPYMAKLMRSYSQSTTDDNGT